MNVQPTTNSKQHGFTLVEIMVALSIFLIVMTISTGSLLGVFDAERKASNMRSVMGNLNLAVEEMVREIRFGTNYNCGSNGNLTVPRDCSSGGSQVNFLSSSGDQVSYRRSGTSLEKTSTGSSGFVPVTAPEVLIDDLTFYVLGSDTEDNLQPKVLIKVKGHSGTGKSRTDFVIETLASQRVFDI